MVLKCLLTDAGRRAMQQEGQQPLAWHGDFSPSVRALKAVAGVNLVTTADHVVSPGEEVRHNVLPAGSQHSAGTHPQRMDWERADMGNGHLPGTGALLSQSSLSRANSMAHQCRHYYQKGQCVAYSA